MKENLTKLLKKVYKVVLIIEKEVILLFQETKQVLGHLKKIWKKKKFKKSLGNMFIASLAAILLFSGAGFLWFASLEIPDLSSFDKRILGQSTKIFDRTGKVLLYDLSQNVRRTEVPFEQISPNIKNATLAIEDANFYTHPGIRITSLIRAVIANVFSLGYTQGGSTITQQVVKNSLLTKEKTITRKIKEIFLALKLEKNLTKDQIFNLYLNESPYGGTIYGIEEASQGFFGTSSSNLTIAQAAYLAAIPQAPTYFSPYGKHRDDLENRKNLVLQEMKQHNYISEEEYNKAKEEKVHFEDQVTGGIKAPHFVMFIKQYLEENYGDKIVNEGGLKVYTTLDYEMQKTAEEIVNKYSLENARLHNASNAGLVAVDPKTGGILVMVGSRDYFDKNIDGNYNIATAKRQPGSSFKPFVYAEAFNQGYRPETVLFDIETQFSTNCSANTFGDKDGCYSPQNYDGRFRGPISLRNALAQSINIPAVKILYLAGIQNSIDLARKMGITTLGSADRYGLTLVLGGGEVTLLDMTSAYGVFANNGVKHPSHGVLKIEDRMGKILEEESTDSIEVMPKDTALLITSVLSDNKARTPVFGANSSLNIPGRDVAAKTGTTNDYRDTWIVGYTPQVAVGAWTGNNDNSPIDQNVAGYIVGPLWKAYMLEILKNYPDEKFEQPEAKDLSDLKPILRGAWQGSRKEKDSEGNDVIVNDVHSILYYVDRENPLGPAPKNPWNDSQFSHWEYGVGRWAANQGLSGSYSQATSPEPAVNEISVSVVAPNPEDELSKNSRINIEIKVVSTKDIKKADYYVNGNYVGSNLNRPFNLNFVPREIENLDDTNTIRVVVTDVDGKTKETTSTFKVR